MLLFQDWSWQTKIVGPSFMTIGFLMLFAGLSLCIIGCKVAKEERDRHYLHSNPGLGHLQSSKRPDSRVSNKNLNLYKNVT